MARLLARDMIPVLGPALQRLRIYATAEGEHLMPLGAAYSPFLHEAAVDVAMQQFKADILTVVDAFTTRAEGG